MPVNNRPIYDVSSIMMPMPMISPLMPYIWPMMVIVANRPWPLIMANWVQIHFGQV